MTEREWLEGTVNWKLMELLGERPSERKYRLLVAACVRRLTDTFPEEVAKVVDTIEGYADGERTKKALLAVHAAAKAMRNGPTLHGRQVGSALYAATWTGATATKPHSERASQALESAAHATQPHTHRTVGAIEGERTAHRAFIGDIFGNPFRPVTFSPEWHTSTAVDLARSMYESRDFSPMPILADALEEAECDNPDILTHCRGDGPHVRGCWVVDLVLGKA